MKVLRIILTIVVVLAALVALLVALALTPAIQTWAVHKTLAGQHGLQVDVGRVSAGPSTMDLTDVRYVKNGLIIKASRVQATYSAWDYVRHHRITVEDFTANDLVIDARQLRATTAAQTGTIATEPSGAPLPAPAPTGKTAAPGQTPGGFNGLLTEAKLPFDVHIARFSVPGRALLAGEQTATFEVHGSDIITGQRGTIDWRADVVSAAAGARVRTLHTSGTAAVHITTERRIDELELNSLTSAEGTNLPTDQLKFDLKAEQPAAGGNEGYSSKFSLVHGTAAEPLATLVGQYNATAHEITGVWNVSVRSEQVATLLTGLGLPDVSAEGAGKFASNPDAGTATTSGDLRSTISHPEKLSPELAPVGQLLVHIVFNGGMANGVAGLEQLAIDATTSNGRKLAEIRTLQRVGFSLSDNRVSFANASADLARVTIDSLPLAWAQPFAKSLKIESGEASLVLAVAATPDGSRVRVTPVEPLTLRNVTVRSGAQTLADQLNLSVKPQAEYSADRLKAELNDLNVTMAAGDTVTGRFTADITHLSHDPTIAFTTDTQAKFVALLKPYLKVDTGPLTVATKSQGTVAGEVLHFASSNTRILTTSGQAVTAIDLVQPVTVNLQTNAVTSEKPDSETLRVTLGQIPLAWAQGFVPNSRFSGQVSGGTIGITVRSLDDLGATVTQPIALRGVSVAMNDQPMLENVDLTAEFSMAKKGPALTYDVKRFEAKQASTTLLSMGANGQLSLAAKPAISAKGTLTADLGALAHQPVASSSASLSRGSLNGTFEVNVGDTVQANARFTAKDLVAQQNNQPLGDADLSVVAAVQPDGSSQLKVPFTLTSAARKSDLLIEGKLSRTGNTITFDGGITSNLLVIDDLKPLAALAPASKPAQGTATSRPVVPVISPTGAPPPTNGPATAPGQTAATGPDGTATTAATANRDAVAFWSAFGGKIALDLKRITYGRDYVISNVRGTTELTPTQLALRSLQGNFKDQPFKVDAGVTFAAEQPQPYTLAGTLDVTNFDVGAILQAANPNERPQLETKVTVTAKLNGKGGTATNLAENVYGTFDANGSKGVLRALGNKSGRAVSGLSGVAGLISAASGSDTATALSELAGKLAELPFDRFTMHVERGADLNLKVSHIEFISPDTRITGSGGIQNQPGVPIQNQPMQFTLQLAGKDDMAVLLNRLKLLSGQKDDQGYEVMSRTFTLRGTPAKADPSDLWSILTQVGTNVIAPALLKMLGH